MFALLDSELHAIDCVLLQGTQDAGTKPEVPVVDDLLDLQSEMDCLRQVCVVPQNSNVRTECSRRPPTVAIV